MLLSETTLTKTDSDSGYHDTAVNTPPWGHKHSVPSPYTEKVISFNLGQQSFRFVVRPLTRIIEFFVINLCIFLFVTEQKSICLLAGHN